MRHEPNIQWDWNLLKRYDEPGPRYTSYPTAPQFKEGFPSQLWHEANARGNASLKPLSLYFHIPFCETVCYYCACNKIITANKKRVQPYLINLAEEIALVANDVDKNREVKQLHWGGGTPTYLNHHQMHWLMAVIDSYFNLQADGEYSIEIHPGLTDTETIDVLSSIGFNRISMGIQDFDPDVQKAVNRFNSYAQVADLVNRARKNDFDSISFDLIYGLPKQCGEAFSATLDRVIELAPDRISLFNYAHMPLRFKTQRQINAEDLPSPHEKLAMLSMSIEKLTQAGYVYIGMDHFAKPEDDLAIAQQHGKLQRNFQGYSTCGGCDLFAFGVSAISAIDNVYLQNTKEIDAYTKLIEKGRKPHVKGCGLNTDDLLRREVINQLACHFTLEFQAISNKWNIDFADYFASELTSLQTMADDNLIVLDSKHLRVLPMGRLLVRHICMVFDAYLKQPAQAAPLQYSRII